MCEPTILGVNRGARGSLKLMGYTAAGGEVRCSTEREAVQLEWIRYRQERV